MAEISSEQLPTARLQPFHEPLRVTLARTGVIALVVGLVAVRVQKQPSSWPQWTAFALR